MDASYFDTRYKPHPGRTRVWKAIVEYLQQFIPPSSRVADIGAGYCDFINQVTASTKYALDTNPEVAKLVGSDVQFRQTPSIEQLGLTDRSIDVVHISNVLEHLSHQQCNSLFDRLEQVFAERGRIVVIQPNYFYCYRRYWDDFTHVRAFSHVSLRDFLVARGYRIIRLEPRFLPFSFNSFLPKSYTLTRLYLSSFWRPFAGQMLAVAQR
jgi:Methyltransferase domain.